MFDCFCFLYIAKIIGEENSVEKQVESARKFSQNVMKKKYTEQAVEYEAEIFKPCRPQGISPRKITVYTA